MNEFVPHKIDAEESFESTLLGDVKAGFYTLPHNKKTPRNHISKFSCGAYGTRTRDPMRDRHVF